ncbi:MAG: sugar kinase [Hyphomicrobiaceae bacterium]|nr:sugar kinase [Hyphomicrobiaceae bacterium]
MIELARGSDGRYGLAYGGDTFNTAVYMARAGAKVSYATRLGDDPYSDAIIATAKAEHVDTALIARAKGRNAGLYMIETTDTGERTFHYWRDRAPARELFDAANADAVISAMSRARLVYLSGITLSLYPNDALDRLASALLDAKRSGAIIAIDGNFRPRGWDGGSDVGLIRARKTFARFFALADIALPTFDDEAMLWGDTNTEQTLARLRSFDVGEIVLKNGPDGAIIASASHALTVPCPEKITAIDTTAAGDSFNAAYLITRLHGATPEAAALAGHRLAGIVIQHRGAIVPQAATNAVLA